MSVASDDRGLLYGDGLFETLRFDAGRCALRDLHRDRLCAGLARIGMPMPAEAELDHGCRQAVASHGGDAVVRVTITRGSGPRGYAPPESPGPTRLFHAGPLPALDDRALVTVTCATPASVNSALAGLKHLGRLDQVLAAAEVRAAGADEGLLTTDDGEVVEGVSGNWVLHLGGAWVTPAVDRAGVAGVFRRWLLDAGQVVERRVSRSELRDVRAAVIVNAVRGFRPVASLDGRDLDLDFALALAAEAGTPW